jgi:quercetin dioxygenase-like cupin family protein
VLLIAIIAAVSGFLATTQAAESGQMLMANPQTLKFAPVPNIPVCATAAPLRGDPTKGPSVLLVKLAPGCRVPWHWHTANEELMFVSGSGTLEMKDSKPNRLRAGSYAYLTGRQVHQLTCTNSCMFFNASDAILDIHYVDAAGKEIPSDEALKKGTPSKSRKK